jgi:hypothetical protein
MLPFERERAELRLPVHVRLGKDTDLVVEALDARAPVRHDHVRRAERVRHALPRLADRVAAELRLEVEDDGLSVAKEIRAREPRQAAADDRDVDELVRRLRRLARLALMERDEVLREDVAEPARREAKAVDDRGLRIGAGWGESDGCARRRPARTPRPIGRPMPPASAARPVPRSVRREKWPPSSSRVARRMGPLYGAGCGAPSAIREWGDSRTRGAPRRSGLFASSVNPAARVRRRVCPRPFRV